MIKLWLGKKGSEVQDREKTSKGDAWTFAQVVPKAQPWARVACWGKSQEGKPTGLTSSTCLLGCLGRLADQVAEQACLLSAELDRAAAITTTGAATTSTPTTAGAAWCGVALLPLLRCCLYHGLDRLLQLFIKGAWVHLGPLYELAHHLHKGAQGHLVPVVAHAAVDGGQQGGLLAGR